MTMPSVQVQNHQVRQQPSPFDLRGPFVQNGPSCGCNTSFLPLDEYTAMQFLSQDTTSSLPFCAPLPDIEVNSPLPLHQLPQGPPRPSSCQAMLSLQIPGHAFGGPVPKHPSTPSVPPCDTFESLRTSFADLTASTLEEIEELFLFCQAPEDVEQVVRSSRASSITSFDDTFGCNDTTSDHSMAQAADTAALLENPFSGLADEEKPFVSTSVKAMSSSHLAPPTSPSRAKQAPARRRIKSRSPSPSTQGRNSGEKSGARIVRKPSRPRRSVDASEEVAKRSKRFSKQSVATLKAWFFDNVSNPYPGEDEKEQLASATGLNMSQINYWFINARRRLLTPQ